MSHFSRIKTSIREIDLLKKSLVNLNLVWEEKEQLIEGYQGETHKVNLVIHQNNIDIGFEKTKDNSYQLVGLSLLGSTNISRRFFRFFT